MNEITYLKGPQEVRCPLEVLSNTEDFMNQIFDTDDSSTTKALLDEVVGGDWFTSVVNLSKTAFVDQLSHALQVRVSPGNIRLANTEHVNCSLCKYVTISIPFISLTLSVNSKRKCIYLVQLHEDSVVDLSKTEKLKSLAYLRVNLVDTASKNKLSDVKSPTGTKHLFHYNSKYAVTYPRILITKANLGSAGT